MSSMPAVVSAVCNEYDDVDCLLAVVVCCKSIRIFVVVVLVVVAFDRCDICFVCFTFAKMIRVSVSLSIDFLLVVNKDKTNFRIFFFIQLSAKNGMHQRGEIV